MSKKKKGKKKRVAIATYELETTSTGMTVTYMNGVPVGSVTMPSTTQSR